MIGLICWTRSFTYDKAGNMVKNANGPIFAAHPQPNLWKLIAENAKSLAGSFDIVQLPPAANGSGEGYTPFCLRNYSSNWGTEADLIAAIRGLHAEGVAVSLDLVYRQMGGENGGPGIFNYKNFPGSTTPSWFQDFGQPGEARPPFVAQDDVPDPSGNYAFGRVRSYQHCLPPGVVEADTIAAYADVIDKLGILKEDLPRLDDGKGFFGASLKRIVESQPQIKPFVEFFSGSAAELYWYVHTVMAGKISVEDYSAYWNTQRACNGYDATQFTADNQGYWKWDSGNAIGFVSNPDVSTSWSPTGGISQQIAFNLLPAYVLNSCLPYKLFLIYAEDYYPASPDYPTGRGMKPLLDNLCWFARTFAFGGYQQRWVDRDIFSYTRDGSGGAAGWSGGCLVAVNFNTLNARTITVQTTWAEGRHVHNYSATGHNEDYTVGAGGKLTITIKSNAYSNGQSYLLIAPAGVNHPVAMKSITE